MRFSNPIEWKDSLPVRPPSLLWRATIKAFYGANLTAAESTALCEATAGATAARDTRELLAVVGRRGGKSEETAGIAVFECTQVGHEVALAPGQFGLFAVISARNDQSAEILNYAKGLCGLAQIKPLVANITRDAIEFKNRIILRVMTCDAVAVSGPTLIGCIRDEWAKWPGSESATPDTETENSLRPALAPVLGAPPRRLIGITSAYIRDGLAFETETANLGVADAPVFCVHGTTEQFNPNIDKAWLAREERRDARAFAREYLAEWQDGLTDGVFADVLGPCVDVGRERTPRHPTRSYVMATDPAWKRDSWAAAICHRDNQTVVVDAVRVWKPTAGQPLSTSSTLADLKAFGAEYGVTSCFTDQAAASVLIEQAQQMGLHLVERAWTGGNKGPRFMHVRSEMADRRIRLPDNRALLAQFRSIRSRLLRAGGEQFEAARGHDDLVSAVVLAVTECIAGVSSTDVVFPRSLFERTTGGMVATIDPNTLEDQDLAADLEDELEEIRHHSRW